MERDNSYNKIRDIPRYLGIPAIPFLVLVGVFFACFFMLFFIIGTGGNVIALIFSYLLSLISIFFILYKIGRWVSQFYTDNSKFPSFGLEETYRLGNLFSYRKKSL